MTVKSVPLPEDNSRKRDWSVEYALLRKCVNVASVHALNGRNAVLLDELLECHIYTHGKMFKGKQTMFFLLVTSLQNNLKHWLIVVENYSVQECRVFLQNPFLTI